MSLRALSSAIRARPGLAIYALLMRLYRCTATSEQQTAELGRALGALLRPGDVVGLDGPLGAGKTTLTRAIAAGMGLDPRQVSSPTFAIVNEYEGEGAGGLAHLDAYRLGSADELDSIDWERLIDPASGLALVIEWAERIEEALPAGRTARIGIGPEGQTVRRFELLLPQEWAARPAAAALLDRCERPVQVTSCPITGRPVPTDSPTWPFVNRQAQMADLHRWFAGEYRLSREATEEDLEG